MGKLSNLFSAATLSANLSYFEYECVLGEETLIPWLSQQLDLKGLSVGDFGCHQGGVLHVLRQQCGIAAGFGFDLNPAAIAGSPFRQDAAFRLEEKDILSLSPQEYQFDVILFRDSLEHIPRYFAALTAACQCLKPGGHLFISYPPYYSPFGGHQQYAENWLKLAPYIHYLPAGLFFQLIRCVDNPYMSAASSIADLHSVRKTRLTLGKLEKAAQRLQLEPTAQELFWLRPAFKVRYGLPIVKAHGLGRIPILREVVVMGAYYLFRKR